MTTENETFQPWQFHGTAKEYFGIWLSNVFLSIITLGVYSAWAKVRRLRYFYGNTRIHNATLQYHATGMQIFIGRLIVFVLLIVVSTFSAFDPRISLFTLAVLMFVAVPWLLNNAMRFRCRMISWNNIHFRWYGSYGGMFKAFVPMAMLAVVAQGVVEHFAVEKNGVKTLEFTPLLMAFYVCFLLVLFFSYYQVLRYIFGSLGWGRVRARLSGAALRNYVGQVCKFFLVFTASMILGAVVIFVSLMVLEKLAMVSPGRSGFSAVFIVAIIFIVVPFIALVGAVYANFSTMLGAALLDQMQAKRDGETPSLFAGFLVGYRWRHVMWIRFTNILMIVFSLGMLSAYCQIRLRHYLVTHIASRLEGDVSSMIDQEQAAISSASAEYSDIEGFDFDLW